MMLGRSAIESALRSRRWNAYRDGVQIEPEDLVIGTNSVDVTLGGKFLLTYPSNAGGLIDPYDPSSLGCTAFEAPMHLLMPGGVVLGYTRERFELCDSSWIVNGGRFDIAPMYDGRSTCGRLFLASHITAGYGDVGFSSCWTLELKNMHPSAALVLHAGMRIGQVSFHLVAGGCGQHYSGAYTNQADGPRAPVIGKERF